ncbi:hypothetical protein CD32_22135 [Lysinibacillus odysseyi 34hs-1 = NBRC 100172]|uniref:Uncharacterized protein n=1 Tax=Lysinibacillus odysseyi 34hs-1 = NBRC 100172 TaxID=1220589 RepID=A0A0A3IET5_9BACI|nr:hypothetical protein CD32_22135 [Lysinibacillus odysseyi 34hs-1 = NBRC 100172]
MEVTPICLVRYEETFSNKVERIQAKKNKWRLLEYKQVQHLTSEEKGWGIDKGGSFRFGRNIIKS